MISGVEFNLESLFQFQKVRLKVKDGGDGDVCRWQFQFQKVRLKDGSSSTSPTADRVSIPKGSIKSGEHGHADALVECFNSKRFD